MTGRNVLVVLGALTCLWMTAIFGTTSKAAGDTVLTGKITGPSGEPMEGVIVSARLKASAAVAYRRSESRRIPMWNCRNGSASSSGVASSSTCWMSALLPRRHWTAVDSDDAVSSRWTS